MDSSALPWPVRKLYQNYKGKAGKEGRRFELTLEDFVRLIEMDCAYCGQPPLQEYRPQKNYKTPAIYNGIDRMDNQDGYTIGNCAAACKVCNRAKRDLTKEQWEAWQHGLCEHRAREAK